MDQSSQLESSDSEFPLASKIAAGFIGFFAGVATFGTAYFATSRDGALPFGITWYGLGMLLLSSVAEWNSGLWHCYLQST